MGNGQPRRTISLKAFYQTEKGKAVSARRAAGNRIPLAERLAKYTYPEPNSGCWLWTGTTGPSGHGQLREGDRLIPATQIALMLSGKTQPSPKHGALHHCDNPFCVNPDHLYWGTQKENTRDAMVRGRANLDGLALGRLPRGRSPRAAYIGRRLNRKKITYRVRQFAFGQLVATKEFDHEADAIALRDAIRSGADGIPLRARVAPGGAVVKEAA